MGRLGLGLLQFSLFRHDLLVFVGREVVPRHTEHLLVLASPCFLNELLQFASQQFQLGFQLIVLAS